MPVWDADVEITAETARCLIRSQFPELEAECLELIGEGWDNAAYLVEREWVFRFPRRRIAKELIETESRVLPLLKDRLSLPIPDPVFQGVAAGNYPYPFAGYPLLKGTPACALQWSDEERANCAPALGAFLRSLHRAPVSKESKSWAPRDYIRRTDLTYRHEQNAELANEFAEWLAPLSPVELIALSESLSRTPPYSGAEHWVHGDGYLCHFLAGESKELCGVIDWGDVHLGDPALDLSIAFSFLPASTRSAFCEAYGEIDEATWLRAQFRAIHYGLGFVRYGAETGKLQWAHFGNDILRIAI